MKLYDGNYVIISHDDETLRMDSYDTFDDAKKSVKEMYDDDEMEFNDEIFKTHFTESGVEGDSYSAIKLFHFKDNELKLIYGNATIDGKEMPEE